MHSGRTAGLLAAAMLLLMQSHVARPVAARGRMAGLPRVTMWSWARREDLRAVDARTAAVATLVRTVTLRGADVRVELQRNSLLLPASAALQRIDVVRIEAQEPALTAETAERTAEAVLGAVLGSGAGAARAGGPQVKALQVDFDAARSQREWYRAVLQQVRMGMPREMPLSITALASWCSGDRWMQGLPVDEAVPMLFRMEPGVRGANDPEIAIREPLCMGAVGVSTRERRPREMAGKRVYVFPDKGWRSDDLAETLRSVR